MDNILNGYPQVTQGRAAFQSSSGLLWNANSSRTTFPPLERKPLGFEDNAWILVPFLNSITNAFISLSLSITSTPLFLAMA